jgi:Ran GTPase-activating protein (RanGAP) involved in mRNA processing and transport
LRFRHFGGRKQIFQNGRSTKLLQALVNPATNFEPSGDAVPPNAVAHLRGWSLDPVLPVKPRTESCNHSTRCIACPHCRRPRNVNGKSHMISSHNDVHRATTPATEACTARALNPPLTGANDKALSAAELRMCPIPPLHDNPFLDYAGADQKTLAWLYDGAKPQSSRDVDDLAFFCVKQALPNALSWLVLQCDVDRLSLKSRNLGPEGVQMIASWLERCPRAIALDLSCQEFGEEGARMLADALKTDPTLTSLNLAHNYIEDIGTFALADALKTNSTLTWLDLTSNYINASGTAALAAALETNSTLTSLNLAGNNIRSPGTVALADAFGTNSTLTSLNVAGNNIDNIGAEAFAHVFKTKSVLTSLNVARNRIGDTGAVALGNALKSNSAMTSLNVEANDIGALGARALADGLKANSTLTSLRVGGNFVDNTGAAIPLPFCDIDVPSAFGEHQEAIDRHLAKTALAKPFVLPAALAFGTLPTSREWKLAVEVGALIVKNMVALGPNEGDGLEGLKSLVIASDIVRQRELDKAG